MSDQAVDYRPMWEKLGLGFGRIEGGDGIHVTLQPSAGLKA